MKIKMIEDFQGELIDNKFYKGEIIEVFAYNDYKKEYIVDCSMIDCDIYETIPYEKAVLYKVGIYDLEGAWSYE